MAKQKTESFAQKSVAELRETVKTLKAELLTAKLQHAKRQLKETRSLTTMRKNIARALTAMREKEVVAKNG